MEVMRVEHQILSLKESKQWLTDTSIKLNQLSANSDPYESNRIIKEFKGYLRKKIGLEKLQKEQDQQYDPSSKRKHSERNYPDGQAAGTYDGDLNRDRVDFINKERTWLKDSLLPMTRF